MIKKKLKLQNVSKCFRRILVLKYWPLKFLGLVSWFIAFIVTWPGKSAILADLKSKIEYYVPSTRIEIIFSFQQQQNKQRKKLSFNSTPVWLEWLVPSLHLMQTCSHILAGLWELHHSSCSWRHLIFHYSFPLRFGEAGNRDIGFWFAI